MTKSYFYFVESDGSKRIKIGASKNVLSRFTSLKSASDCPLVLLGFIEGGFGKEKELHNHFSHKRVHGEWFDGSIRPEIIAMLGLKASHDEIEFLNKLIEQVHDLQERLKERIKSSSNERAQEKYRDAYVVAGSSLSTFQVLLDMAPGGEPAIQPQTC